MAGADSINLTAAGAVKSGLKFGVTASAGLVINYGSVSDAFDASTSSLFSIGGSAITSLSKNLVTVSYSGNTGIFLKYDGGAQITFLGASGITADFSALYTEGGGTAVFGVAATFPTFS